VLDNKKAHTEVSRKCCQKHLLTRYPLSTKVTSKESGGYSDLIMVNCKWLIVNCY